MRRWIGRVLIALVAFVLGAGAWVGFETYSIYNDVNATYHQEKRIAIEPKATPVTDFFGRRRVNFLVLGSDNDRKAEERHPLTQSMIIVSVDPVHNTVNMLSIPRDFYVRIPGHGMGKIDLAAKYGWVPLARATVEKLFGINIDYYAWVGLNGFRSVIDDFGGVTLNITHPILDDFYPNDQIPGDPYAFTRVFMPPGWRHLSGRQALQYVRSRHGDAVGDFGRSNRQQEVLLQLRRKAAGWNLILKIPELAHDLRNAIRTDVAPTRMFDVGRLARHITSNDIHRYVLSAPTFCTYGFTPDRQSILIPNWRVITPLVRRLFGPIPPGPAPTPQPAPTATPQTLPTSTAKAGATPRPTGRPSATAAPATPTPAPPSVNRLPGTLLYTASGTFFRMTPSMQVSNVMPSWMTAADMPAVSPDGRSLIFMRWSTYATDLYRYDLRTRAVPVQITHDASPNPRVVNNAMWAAWPTWSPDGKTVLFSSDRYKLQTAPSETRKLDMAIYAMSPDGSNVRQLTTPATGAGGDTDAQFRGRTSQYLYDHWAYHMQGTLAVGQPYSQLMLRDLNAPVSTPGTALTPDSGQVMQPALNRTGDRVAYVRVNGTISQVVVARIVSTKAGPQLRDEQVLASGEVAQPAFSPDGRWVSYLRADGDGFSIWLQGLGGGATVRLTQPGTGVDAISRPIWLP